MLPNSPSNVALRAARCQSGRGTCFSTCARAGSTSLPYCTPEGHTFSQARQSRHSYIWCTQPGLLTSSLPSATALISVIRPRGEEVSTFVSTQVGQEVRQKPQR